VDADLAGANLSGCPVYGLSAWGLKLDERTPQQNLVITPKDGPDITVDNIEVAQFVYLLLLKPCKIMSIARRDWAAVSHSI
jgi:hypothetical protein